MKQIILLLLFMTNSIRAQHKEIDTIFYGMSGGKVRYTNSHYFMKDSISILQKFTGSKKTKKISKVNTFKNWNTLLNKIDINSFKKIKSGNDRSEYCGTNTYITLKLKNGKMIGVINAENNKMWNEIKEELEKQKIKIE